MLLAACVKLPAALLETYILSEYLKNCVCTCYSRHKAFRIYTAELSKAQVGRYYRSPALEHAFVNTVEQLRVGK